MTSPSPSQPACPPVPERPRAAAPTAAPRPLGRLRRVVARVGAAVVAAHAASVPF